MPRRFLPFLCITAILSLCLPGGAVRAEEWFPLFDGRSLAGWKAAENPGSFRVENGQIVCDGPRAHLFYAGDVAGADFTNFELQATVMTRPGANSGIYFHTAYQDSGYPTKGYEVQVNNTYTGHGSYYEYKKTGSLYGVRNQYKSIVADDEWFTLRILVEGRRIRVFVNDRPTADYVEPDTPIRGEKRRERELSHGTIALQCHDENSKVMFRDIRVRPLPEAAPPAESPVVDATFAAIQGLQEKNFPLVDLHVHLKGGLTLDEAIGNSLATGINYGIAVNCGLGFPVTDDAGADEFLRQVQGKPVFVGMQAEGREWQTLFSPETIARFDYVFTDAMTFTDDRGKRTRLWIPEEVEVGDKQAFMEMLVDRIEKVLAEPIDIYVNPTFLPDEIAAEYDALWTPERMDRVIDAAVANDVAIEINARYRIPSVAFIKRAKAAGAKFTFGTNNTDRELGRLEYCLDVIRECNLAADDIFLPNREEQPAAKQAKQRPKRRGRKR